MSASLGDHPRRVIEQAFEAFGWRPEPRTELAVSYLLTGVTPDEAEEMLAGVARREMSDALYDSIFLEPSEMLNFTTPEACLYYMPVLFSRCVRDIEHAPRGGIDITADAIVWRFRHFPVFDSVLNWPHLLVTSGGEKKALAMRTARDWLMVGTRWQDTLRLVAQMTSQEKRAIVALFDYFLSTKYWEEEEGKEVASAKALLTGRGAMDVLLVRTDAECMEIVDVLTELAAWHPRQFPTSEVASLKNLMLDIVAGRRPRTTKLGW